MSLDSLPEGLCADCRHARRVDTAGGAVYWRCASDAAGLGRYPRLPVAVCAAYEADHDDQEA